MELTAKSYVAIGTGTLFLPLNVIGEYIHCKCLETTWIIPTHFVHILYTHVHMKLLFHAWAKLLHHQIFYYHPQTWHSGHLDFLPVTKFKSMPFPCNVINNSSHFTLCYI